MHARNYRILTFAAIRFERLNQCASRSPLIARGFGSRTIQQTERVRMPRVLTVIFHDFLSGSR